MPELPEVETMVRGIRPHVVGRTIAAVIACPVDCRPLTISPEFPAFAEESVGRTVVSVRRLGKRVVLDLGISAAEKGDRHLVIEPRMTGLVLLADPPTSAHLRLEWRLGPRCPPAASSNDSAIYNSFWFWDRRGLGTVRLYNADGLAQYLSRTRLANDALELTATDWIALCRSTKRAIKVALLDQTLVAGIGNLYASEILHLARIHPERSAASLSRARITRLQAAAVEVLEEAIRYEGSTLGDGTYRNALSQAGSYQNEHRVYMKADQRCPSCSGADIRRIVQAQRSTFYCPRCQK